MRRLALAALLLVACLANASSAAPVELLFRQDGIASDLWDLNLVEPNPGEQIAAVAFSIVGNGALDFTIWQPANVIDPFSPTGFSVKDNTTVPGQIHIVLNIGTPGPIATGPAALLLGFLHFPVEANFQTNFGIPGFLPGDADGGTIQDVNFNSLPYVVGFNNNSDAGPAEPATMLLLGIGVAGLALSARPRGRTGGSSRPPRAPSSAR